MPGVRWANSWTRERNAVRHPSDRTLQLFSDDALRRQTQAAVQAHLAQCAACRRRLESWQAVSRAVRQARPATEAFPGDGIFWVRLVQQLNTRPRPAWSLVTFLPPFVFVTIGTLLNLFLGAAVLMRVLVRAGAIAPIGPLVCARLRTLLGQTEAGQMLRAWIGPTAHQLATSALDAWAAMSPVLQDALLYVLIIVNLGLALVGVLTLYGWWAACWTREERLERSKQAWNTASWSSEHFR